MAKISSLHSQNHAFAGNPLIRSDPKASLRTLQDLFQKTPEERNADQTVQILPLLHGKPLVLSVSVPHHTPSWHLAWQSFYKFREVLKQTDQQLDDDNLLSHLVYLGHREAIMYWALDLSDGFQRETAAFDSSRGKTAFVDVRTLMVGTDWSDGVAMAELSIAGHARAMLEWHSQTQFCGRCGAKCIPKDAGRQRQCNNDMCKKRLYPRLDPVVIMLVIDKANDRALLARQPQFLPHMWSCLAGFIELGESLEEAVRRETWEEVGIEVNEVVYHSSQPWPVGPSKMSCQMMVGFFAFAKSFDIHVDKNELEDARWYSREEVKKALAFTKYWEEQRTSAVRINQICSGVKKTKGLSSMGEHGPMFVPGLYAIAHHLVSSWTNWSPDMVHSRL